MPATDIERLIVSLEANVNKFNKAFDKARADGDRVLGAIEDRASRAERAISQSFGRMGEAAKGAATAIGAALSLRELRNYADTWQDMVNKIVAAGEKASLAPQVQDRVTNIAMDSRSDLKSTTDLYVGLRRATEELGASQAQVFRVVETVNKAFAVGGASASEQASGILQLNQALSSGVLQGDELRSIRENAPLIAKAIANEFGVTIGGLKKLGEEGALTADRVFKALLNSYSSINSQFQKTNATVSQAFSNLNTALTRYFGQIDQASGISRAFATAINGVATNIDTVVKAAAVLGVGLATGFQVALPVIGAVGLGLGPIVAGVAAAGAAFALFGDQVRPIAGEFATIMDYGRAAFEIVSSLSAEAAAAMQDKFGAAAQMVTQILSGLASDQSLSMLLSAVKTTVNAIVGAFAFAGAQIVTTWQGIGPAIVGTIVNAMNAVIAAIEGALQRIAGSINGALGSLGVNINVPNLGRIESQYANAGRDLAKAYGENFALLTKDYVGQAIDATSAALDKIRQRANEIGKDRALRDFRAGERQDQLNPGSLDQKLKPPAKEASGGGGGGGADKQNEYQKELQNIEQRITAFGREQEALRLSAFEAAKAEASFKLLDAAKKANIPVTDELRGKIGQLAEAYATAKTSLDNAKQSQEQFQELQRFVGTSLSSFFSDVVSGGKNAERALMNLTKKLADAALQALLLGDGPLAGLFGTGGAKGSVGGLIGALFGGFGGGKAAGGPVKAGTPYVVGEKRPELFVPSTSGRIIPRVPQGIGSGRGGGPISFAPTYNIGAPAEGVTPAMLAAVLRQNNQEMSRRLPQLLHKSNQRYG